MDKDHRHVCGHSNFRDIRTLLERNGLWRDDYYKYLSHVLESCLSCHETELPQKARTVSLNTISREFNQLVFVEHFSWTTWILWMLRFATHAVQLLIPSA